MVTAALALITMTSLQTQSWKSVTRVFRHRKQPRQENPTSVGKPFIDRLHFHKLFKRAPSCLTVDTTVPEDSGKY